MRKEIILMFVVGMFILTYIMDAVSGSPIIRITSPYQYFTNLETFSLYPFSTASVVIKAIALTTLIWLSMSFMEKMYWVKAGILLAVSLLFQLYSVQNIVSKSNAISLEWSLGLTLAGVFMIILTIVYFLSGLIDKFISPRPHEQ